MSDWCWEGWALWPPPIVPACRPGWAICCPPGPDPSGQPLLDETLDGLKLRVFVQQRGAAVESSRGDPGIRQGQGMAGLDLRCADQQGLTGFQPVDRQRLQLLIGEPAGTFTLVLPDADQHLHPGDETGGAAHRTLQAGCPTHLTE